jgi:putative ABC transport system permease protein
MGSSVTLIRRLALIARFALRELRGGLRGFGVFIACIALGVAAIAGVAAVARGMTEGIAREGQAILGGDISFTLTQRLASAEERAWLDKLGTVSEVATLRGMARRADGGDQALVEVKASSSAALASRSATRSCSGIRSSPSAASSPTSRTISRSVSPSARG